MLTVPNDEPLASGDFLPEVYEELRKLATSLLAAEKPGQTLQATGLVHEAYLRLIDVEQSQVWNSCGHFFAAAAIAMRRALIDRARAKGRGKRGGGWQRVDFDQLHPVNSISHEQLIDLDDSISRLAIDDPIAARLVELRYFLGISIVVAAESLNIHKRIAYRHWEYARAWLYCDLLQPS